MYCLGNINPERVEINKHAYVHKLFPQPGAITFQLVVKVSIVMSKVSGCSFSGCSFSALSCGRVEGEWQCHMLARVKGNCRAIDTYICSLIATVLTGPALEMDEQVD